MWIVCEFSSFDIRHRRFASSPSERSINHQLEMNRALKRKENKNPEFFLFYLQAWKMSLSFVRSPVDHVDFLHNLYFLPRTYTRCWWSNWLHMGERKRENDEKFTHVNLEKYGRNFIKIFRLAQGSKLVYDFFYGKKSDEDNFPRYNSTRFVEGKCLQSCLMNRTTFFRMGNWHELFEDWNEKLARFIAFRGDYERCLEYSETF